MAVCPNSFDTPAGAAYRHGIVANDAAPAADPAAPPEAAAPMGMPDQPFWQGQHPNICDTMPIAGVGAPMYECTYYTGPEIVTMVKVLWKSATEWQVMGVTLPSDSAMQLTPEYQAYLHSPDAAESTAKSDPLVYNGQVLRFCDIPGSTPESASTYICVYKDGSSTFWRSITDLTLLKYRTGPQGKILNTPAGDAADKP
jgi:hypothetical protein